MADTNGGGEESKSSQRVSEGRKSRRMFLEGCLITNTKARVRFAIRLIRENLLLGFFVLSCVGEANPATRPRHPAGQGVNTFQEPFFSPFELVSLVSAYNTLD